MSEQKSIVKSTRVKPSVDEMMSTLGIDFNEFVEDRLENEIRTKFDGQIDQMIIEYENKIRDLKKLKRKFDPAPKTADEAMFLSQTREILKDNPKIIQGRIKAYSTQFDKVILNEEDFIKLVDTFDK